MNHAAVMESMFVLIAVGQRCVNIHNGRDWRDAAVLFEIGAHFWVAGTGLAGARQPISAQQPVAGFLSFTASISIFFRPFQSVFLCQR